MEAAFHLEPSRITISAQKLHHNKHPSWAWGTDRSTGADGAMILTTPAQPALLRGNVTSELRDFFPDLDEIRGSQWLPELYDADGAVACVPSVFLEGKRGVDDQNFSLVFCEEEPGPDAPILYRLNSL
ncbi:MAG: hypothetical protein HY795_03495 [Desulfovibrio sp.]|nr:hypothetical protein [Desulfovibrio sp.]MBI4959117.1 hypothetical protein [Desulfovibrio sp.]